MKRVLQAPMLQEAIGRVDRGGQGFSVSFFASPAKIEAWCADGALAMLPCEGALLVLRRDGNLLRVGHVAADPPALSAALGKLVEAMPTQLMVADLVGKPRDAAPIVQTYRRHGFAPHAQLIRMQRTDARPVAVDGATDVELARVGDVPALRAFLQRWLDPLAEQIPGEGELQEAVAAEAVHVVRDGGGLAGLLIQETLGQSAVLRYWHVAGDRHGRGIGSRLMHAFFARCASSRRVTLWVIAGNAGAIAKYHHYGFSADGMVDNIMVRQPEAATR